MPEGYEDVNSLKSLKARQKQLVVATVGDSIKKDDWLVREERIWGWCSRHNWIRELPWPTHKPLLFEQKQQLACTDCLYAKRRPLYLWWRSTKDTYICNSCYAKREWNEIMPKGYEDVRFYKDMMARKKQLDGLASGHATTFPRTSGSSHGHVGSKSVHSTLTRPASDSMTSNDLTPSRKFSSTTLASISGVRHKKPENDSIIRERQRERWRRWPARLRLKPEAYRAYLDGLSTAAMKRHDEGPAYRERKKDRDRARIEKARLESPGYKLRNRLKIMVLRHSWTRTDLPWQLYRPIVTSEPIEHYCSGCKYTRRKGLRLWWHTIDPGKTEGHGEPESFLCHACYL
jgi:hypothetical protein